MKEARQYTAQWIERIHAWIQRWVAPAQQIEDPFERNRALNTLLALPLTLLINLAVQAMLLLRVSLISPDFLRNMMLVHMAYMLLLIGIARLGAYRLAAIGLYAGVIAIVILASPYTLGVPERALSFSVLALLLVTPLLPARVLFGLALLTGIAVLMLAQSLWIGGPPSYAFIAFLTLTLVTLVSLAWMREHSLLRIAQSERRYRDLMQAGSEMILIFDAKGPLLDANQAFLDVSGFTLEELRQKKLIDLIPEEQREQLRELWSAGRIVNNPGEIQMRLGQSASRLHLEYRIREHDYMGRPAYVAALRDVTAQKQAEREREERERLYRSLFTQTSDAVFLVDMDGIIRTINQAAVKILGAQDERDIIGRPHTDFVEPSELEQAAVMRQRILNGESFPAYERTFRRLDGSKVVCEINATMVYDPRGRPLHIQSAVRDLTERKRSEAQRFELALQRERVRLLESFIEDAAHYFRTPMANIRTSLYLLPRFADQPEKQAYQIGVMQSEMQRLERLLEDLLTVKRLEKEETLAHTQIPIEINGLLEQVKYMRNANLPEPRWTLEGSEKPLHILGSPNMIVQALDALMDNAETYTTNGGALRLRCFGRNNYAIIEVQDEGIGIPPQDLPRIFENFYRSDRARTIRYSSSGLGLPIAQKIVALHHGQIEAESEPDKGSTFRVMLPRLQVPERSSEPATPLD